MKICTRCKQPIEDGKLFCGSCGGLGAEVETEKNQSNDTCNEETGVEQAVSAEEKQKIVDLTQWESEFPLNKALNNPKIPRIFTILKVIGVIVLIGVSVSLLMSAINALKKDEISEVLMLALAKPKWEKFTNVLFVGALVLYLLLWVPYVKLYLLISKTKFIKKSIEKAKAAGVKTESHKDCLERLLKEEKNEDFGEPYAYLLALDQTRFMKELFYSFVKICGKLLELICLFVLAKALLDKLMVPNPSMNITFLLTHPAVWGLVVCAVIDVFVPSFREADAVCDEIDRLDIKDAVDKK